MIIEEKYYPNYTSRIETVEGFLRMTALSGFSGVIGTDLNGTIIPIDLSGFSGSTSGYSGYSGAQGASGYSGYSGRTITGQSGYSGFSGFSGIRGYSGYSGYRGYSGWSGMSGTSGYSGQRGYSGEKGNPGTRGYSGYSGFSGLNGSASASGYSGYSGYSGSNGTNGTMGPQGYSGYSGISGFSGFSGQAGNTIPASTAIITDSTINPTKDMYIVKVLSQDTAISNPAGSFVNGERLLLRIKDDGTSRALSWNGVYRANLSDGLPTATNINETLYIEFIYNYENLKWDLYRLVRI